MRLLKQKVFLVIPLFFILMHSCSTADSLDEPQVVDNLSRGSGMFSYTYSSLGFIKNMNVYYYIPQNKNATTPILFVFHGTERNANQYRNAMIAKAESMGFIVIAPEFSEQNFPGGDAYNLGNVFEDGDNPSANTLNPENEWTFSVIEPLFDYLKIQINSSSLHYHIFGHSAGAQFVHRFLMFKPNARVTRAVISAAGWYTFPNNVVFPYGKSQSPLENMQISNFLSKNVFVQIGQLDNDPNAAGLRHTILADAQGLNRKDRAENYFDFCQQLALNSNLTFNWAFNSVANADHDYIKASENAANLIFN